jgi:hypothetical protein
MDIGLIVVSYSVVCILGEVPSTGITLMSLIFGRFDKDECRAKNLPPPQHS